MVRFKGHEIRDLENGYTEILLHLDTSPSALEEFSHELGNREDLELQKASMDYVKKNLPQVKYKKIKVMMAGVVVATMLGTALVVPGASNQAYAAETTVGITGGELVQATTLDVGVFDAVVLNGITQDTHASISDFNISDPRGSGTGWNVVMKASPFTNADGDTLPAGSLTVSAPSLTTADAGSSPAGDITTSSGTIDNGTGSTIISAESGQGMGSYTVSFLEDSLSLRVPAGAYSGTYTSTISVEINSGP
ncbi:WxL domain-containing protein [Ornithinibacillus contaminans]|uniref:WxL domain-containing protein n=1 Tax=Ornithinibacillus contaminans TaxID=694055 RepID=UPI00064DFFB4|nr:WxL domain-containing protein [Ornithinibacillus contaminans]